jgi:predicted RNA binding protein YcfA (HicA-like mRNA interferase family)
MSSRELIRRLERDGWVLVRTRGSHRQYRHPEKPGLITVPHPKHDLPTGTLRAIFRAVGWTWSER